MQPFRPVNSVHQSIRLLIRSKFLSCTVPLFWKSVISRNTPSKRIPLKKDGEEGGRGDAVLLEDIESQLEADEHDPEYQIVSEDEIADSV